MEQEFNSLDAQREACEAYILSQKHEGWKVISTQYDDGGFSGGNMERPALARLMDDIRARRVDVVVVYKVDRLTRSLSDFAKIVEVFDSHGVSFVSVTQQFNTTTSMGRLTLNVLLSFAQFEREVTGERIRDKIAASKKKGMFMGGGYPLGYDLKDHHLIVNKTEAANVRAIFDLYIELRSVRRVSAELARRGIVSKVYRSEVGRIWGGRPLTRSNLYYILRNRTYLGEIAHKGQVHVGEHEAIVDRVIWEEVQTILAGNARDRSDGNGFASPSLLAGILFDDKGNKLTPSHTQKGKVRYRYYVCQALLQNRPEKAGRLKRVPAVEVEDAVEKLVLSLLSKPGDLIRHALGDKVLSATKQNFLTAVSDILLRIKVIEAEKRAFIHEVIQKVVVSPDQIAVTFEGDAMLSHLGVVEGVGNSTTQFTVPIPIRVTRSGRQKRMIIADDKGEHRLVNDGMVMAIARALRWDGEIREGASLRLISKQENLSTAYITRVLPLAFLAPDIVQAVYEGRQPIGLKVKELSANLPLEWTEQRRSLGFPAL